MIDRINELIEFLGFSQTQFADTIGINRSILSHIMKGRNKPSLEVVNRILETFPQVSPDWLLWGKGSSVREENLASSGDGRSLQVIVKEKIKEVNRITIYYEDGTFCDFLPKGS